MRFSFIHIVLAVGTIIGIVGCGSTGEVGTISSNASSTELAITGTVVSSTDASKALILETSSSEVTVSEITDGSFSATVESGEYAIALLDDNNETVALLVQDGSSTFSIDASTDLGTVTVDSDTSVATSSATLTSASTSVSKAVASADIDLGDMKNLSSVENHDNGTTVSDVLSSGQADIDSDLVPNFLDNDNNEDGIYDNNQGLTLCPHKVVPSADPDSALLASIESALDDVTCLVFDNLKLQATALLNGDGDANPHTDEHFLAVHLGVPASLVASIDSVTMASLPSFADGTVSNAAGGWTFSTTYPTVGDAWSSTAHAVPHATNPSGDDEYSIWITPNGDPVPSLFIYQMNLTDGSIVYFATRLFYVFNTPAKVTAVADGATTTTLSYPMTDGDAGTRTNPLSIAGAGPLVLTADRPLESVGGLEVCGMGVQAHIFYLDATGTQLGTAAVMTTPTSDTGACNPAVDLSLSLDLATYFPTTSGGTAIASYQVDFTVVGNNGDNTAEILYFRY